MKTTLKESLGVTVLPLLVPCVLVGLLAGCATHPPIAAELKPLQGYWEGEGAGGKCSITITGNSLHYRVGNNWYKTTFTLPAGTDPQQLHATIQDCSPPSTNAIGKVVFAIFKIEDGTLTLAEDDMSENSPHRTGSRLMQAEKLGGGVGGADGDAKNGAVDGDHVG